MQEIRTEVERRAASDPDASVEPGVIEVVGRVCARPSPERLRRARRRRRRRLVTETGTVLALLLADALWGSSPGTQPAVSDDLESAAVADSSVCMATTVPVGGLPLPLQDLWSAYDISVVPPCAALATPPLPHLRVRTATPLDAGQARDIARATLRGLALENWSLATGEDGMLPHIELPQLARRPPGATVTFTRGCDLPSVMTLVTVPGSTAATLTHGLITHDLVGVLASYTGACSQIDRSASGSVAVDPSGSLAAGETQTDLLVGIGRRDRAIGQVLYRVAAVTCPGDGDPSVAAVCAHASR